MTEGLSDRGPAAKAFDRPNKESRFLTFVAKEFVRRGTPIRDQLADKMQVGSTLDGLGIRQPRRLAELDDIGDLPGLDLPDRFALKYAHGWSARGVMLLRRLAGHSFFCLLNQRTFTLAQIVESQRATAASFPHKPNQWVVEELIESTVDGRPIPLDYKFYCFGPRVALVVQIDRNTLPVKICLLRPDFTPMEHKSDYLLDGSKAQLGIPLVPVHAAQLSAWAEVLSSLTGSPFVSVDLYDSPRGAVFGEFTFSPGGTHRRLWRFGSGVIDALDDLYARAEALSEAGHGAWSATEAARIPVATPAELEVYGLLAASVLNGSKRGAARLSELHRARTDGGNWGYADSWTSIGRHLAGRMREAQEDYDAVLEQRS